MKKIMLMAALSALGVAHAQETVVTQNTEVHTLPGGTKVTVENNTRILYQETGIQKLNKPTRRVAIFTRNDTGVETTKGAEVRIENQLRSLVAGKGFEVINVRTAIEALKPLPEAARTADGVAQVAKVTLLQAFLNRLQGNKAGQKNLGGDGLTSDEKLLAQTAIVPLAQQLGADYIMLFTLNGFEPTELNNAGRWVYRYRVNATYELMDFAGYSIGGGVVEFLSKTYPQNERRNPDAPYPIEVDSDIAKKLAADMQENAEEWRIASLANSKIPVSFDAIAMTMDNMPLYTPMFDAENPLVVLDAQAPVRIAALVEVDGVTVGTTDCVVPLTPGMHKVRVFRSGFDDVNMTINAQEGLKIVVPTRITEGHAKSIQELQKFIHNNNKQGKITAAIAEQYKGKAEMLRNSHIRVDANNLPNVNVMQTVVPGTTLINNTSVVK